MNKVIYLCINLARSQDRRVEMEAEAKRAGIDIQFVEAIDGQSLQLENVPEYARKQRLKYAPDLARNEVACALSHKRALKTFLASDAHAAVILEDDAAFHSNFAAFVEAVVNLPIPWHAVMLHNRHKKFIPPSLISPIAGSGLFASSFVSRGAEAWLFSRTGASLVLRSLSHFRHGYDTHIGFFWRHGLAPLVAYPPVAFFKELPSTISNTNEIRRLKEADLSIPQKLRSRIERINHECRKEIAARLIKARIKQNLARAGYTAQS